MWKVGVEVIDMKVTYEDHMGDDLAVVNAARVSFGKKSGWEEGGTLSKADQGLIQFLARGCTSGEWDSLLNEVLNWYRVEGQEDQPFAPDFKALLNHIKKMPDHWTPFGHTAITLHIKAPIFVARQLGKHQVGFVWNEVSRRYITDKPEFYGPDVWRKAAKNVKQGSSDEEAHIPDFEKYLVPYEGGLVIHCAEDHHQLSLEYYRHLLDSGVCPEQARMVLPQSMYTEWIWTGNLYGFANVYNQRTDPHAQKEVRDVAHQIGEIIEPLFPVSWKELTK